MSKASYYNDVPTKINKINSDIFQSFVFQSFNYMIDVSFLPTGPKSANVVPAFNKG